ncbi:MAG: phage integrase N-terminal SAM-like domain-containing protein [Syntrophobacteraceae bacterium]
MSLHYSRRTEEACCHWGNRFIYSHNIRLPAGIAEPKINVFLSHLAVKEDYVDHEATQRSHHR